MKNKKGFTIVELLVVIAVVAILVLLAVLGISNYIEKAKVTRIQNDVRAVENVSNAYNLEHGEYDIDGFLSPIQLQEKANEGKFYTREGKEEEVDKSKTYEKLSSSTKGEVSSSLPGDFVIDGDGNVGYIDESSESKPFTEDEIGKLIEEGYVPIANGHELQKIDDNNSSKQLFGEGTGWEGQYVGKLDSKFIQVKDIDLSSFSNWVPIGDSTDEYFFAGVYNGGNYKIENLSASREEGNGLFGHLAISHFRNMKLNNFSLDSDYSSGALSYISSVSNDPNNLEKIVVENVSIRNLKSSSEDATGGLIAQVYNNIDVNNVNIIGGNLESESNAGGLFSIIVSGGVSSIEYSSFMGSINSKEVLGGIIGEIYSPRKIKNVYVYGNLTSEGPDYGSNVGGIIGSNGGNGTIENSSFNGKLTSLDTTGEHRGTVGGIIGANNGSSGSIINSISNGDYIGGRVGGIVGGINSPFDSIENVEHYGNLIGFYNVGGIVGEINSNLNIIKNTISEGNYTINSEGHYYGIVGGIIGTGSLDNLSVVNSNYKGNLKSTFASGGIVGTYNGSLTIDNSHAEGDYSAWYSEEKGTVAGGLIGQQTRETSISNSSYKGELKGALSIGGLVGESYGKLTLENLSAEGNIINNNDYPTENSGFEYYQYGYGGISGDLSHGKLTDLNLSNVDVKMTIDAYRNIGKAIGSYSFENRTFTEEEFSFEGTIIENRVNVTETTPDIRYELD